MVTTPVPPMPVTRMLATPSGRAATGSGRAGKSSCRTSGVDGFCRRAPSTLTKEGQKPSTQVKSLLQDDWLIFRFLPRGVSRGSTDRQLETLPQSPQPSQTALLMKVRRSGSGHLPRFLRRRRSVAQGWS